MNETETAAEPVLSVQGLSHSYKRTRALRNVSFEVEHGAIHGFVGPNGAGKTTTLKVLATLLKPQSGRAVVMGNDIARRYKQVRKLIGYMPDYFGLYPQMTVFENLDFFGAAYGIDARGRSAVIDDVLQLTDMAGRRDALVRSLSRGMEQRLSLARALINDPRLLLLDEPASGLDPRARIELMEILKELGRMGKTIFISSHILGELAGLCDSVTIIDRGTIRYTGPMADLLAEERGATSYLLTLRESSEAVEAALRAIDGVLEVTPEAETRSYRIRLDASKAETNAVLQAVIEVGAAVESFRVVMRELSQAFMDLTEPGVPS